MTFPLRLRKFRSEEAAEGYDFQLHLFRSPGGQVCGWYIGPVGQKNGQIEIPYLPPSKLTLAPVAVVRAIKEAKAAGSTVCIVDPDDLWEPAWRASR